MDTSIFHYKKFIDAKNERDRLREENKKLHIEAIKLMRDEVNYWRKETEELRNEINRMAIKKRRYENDKT